MENMLGKTVADILMACRPYLDFKFHEFAILGGVEEHNQYAKKLYHDVVENKILKSKAKSKKDDED